MWMKGKQSGKSWTEAVLITELEFTEALLGLSKDAIPGPDLVKCSDTRNLSVYDKSGLFILVVQRKFRKRRGSRG